MPAVALEPPPPCGEASKSHLRFVRWGAAASITCVCDWNAEKVLRAVGHARSRLVPAPHPKSSTHFVGLPVRGRRIIGR